MNYGFRRVSLTAVSAIPLFGWNLVAGQFFRAQVLMHALSAG